MLVVENTIKCSLYCLSVVGIHGIPQASKEVEDLDDAKSSEMVSVQYDARIIHVKKNIIPQIYFYLIHSYKGNETFRVKYSFSKTI